MSESTRETWHLDKRVQISHIVTTCGAILAMILYLGDIKKDVEILKVQYAAQVVVDQNQDKNFKEALKNMNDQLLRMDNKLDRLIEKGSSK